MFGGCNLQWVPPFVSKAKDIPTVSAMYAMHHWLVNHLTSANDCRKQPSVEHAVHNTTGKIRGRGSRLRNIATRVGLLEILRLALQITISCNMTRTGQMWMELVSPPSLAYACTSSAVKQRSICTANTSVYQSQMESVRS
eukprot:1186910-Prorocentrum_minimum.AAC.2